MKKVRGAALFFVASICAMGVGHAQSAKPKIAVTDLAYTEEVSQYFSVGEAKGSSTVAANRGTVAASSQYEQTSVSGSYSYIRQSELRSFVADIRGALLKGTTFGLVQGRTFDAGDPQPTKAEQVLEQVKTGKMAKPVRQPEVLDIIARIKKGEFPGANYVLFGTLSNLQFLEETNPLQGTSSATYIYGVDLVADFSLIDTKTYEIFGAFSAEGAGKDIRVLSVSGGAFTPNRAKVMRDASKKLADSVFSQLVDQFDVANPDMSSRVRRSTDGSGRRN